MGIAEVEIADDGSAVSSVTCDPDLWSYVLSRLSLPQLLSATATCRSHHQLLHRAREGVVALRLQPLISNHGRHVHELVELRTTRRAPFDLVNTSSVDANEAFVSHLPIRRTLYHFSDGRSDTRVDALSLERILRAFRSIQSLVIDLSPVVDDVQPEHAWLQTAAMRRSERGKLSDLRCTASTLDPACVDHDRAQHFIGPMPYAVFPRARVMEVSLSTSVAEPRKQCWPQVGVLLLPLAISYGHFLQRLDLTGLAPSVAPTLMRCELPALRLLRVGEPAGADYSEDHTWPASGATPWLTALGRKFSTLEGLDVGFGDFPGGIDFPDLAGLCAACPRLLHLDLSRVMTWIDFGPALRVLALRAPQLRSLAVYGLELPTHDLLELASGCRDLRAAHFNGCKYTDDGLLAFLRAAEGLVHLDLSLGNAPQYELLTWLEERQLQADQGGAAVPPPVASLAIVRSVVILPADHQAHAEAMSAVGISGPGGAPIPMPTQRVANPGWPPQAEARLHAFYALARNACPALEVQLSNEYGSGSDEAGTTVDERPLVNTPSHLRTRILERVWRDAPSPRVA